MSKISNIIQNPGIIGQYINGVVEDVTDPTKNSINEKCARIRRAFVSHLGAYKAEPYIISGPRGEKKKISLDRDYVQFEQS